MNTLLMSPDEICDELAFINWAALRDGGEPVDSRGLRQFFGNASDALERRYQRELAELRKPTPLQIEADALSRFSFASVLR